MDKVIHKGQILDWEQQSSLHSLWVKATSFQASDAITTHKTGRAGADESHPDPSDVKSAASQLTKEHQTQGLCLRTRRVFPQVNDLTGVTAGEDTGLLFRHT